MAIGFPVKDDYATGDILTAANMNDLAGTVNTVSGPVATAAGKNKIINGDFRINQRGFTSTTSSATYGLDRWRYVYSGGTTTYSTQTFTLGAAPVAGYEGVNFARLVTSGQSAATDFSFLQQRIESVRTFAGQTVTFSLWAKAASGTPNINVRLDQTFGSGGSPSTAVTNISTAKAISTSWARYSFAINVASISGKTIGTNGDDFLGAAIFVSDGGNQLMGTGAQNNTFDIWGVQVEAGSVATEFQTATGTLQGELAACQRYYYRQGTGTNLRVAGTGQCSSTTTLDFWVPFPVAMRAGVSALEQTGTAADYNVFNRNTSTNCSAVPTHLVGSSFGASVRFTVASGLIAGEGGLGRLGTDGFLGWSAEL